MVYYSELSKLNKIVIYCFNKGYKVLETGILVSPQGYIRKLNERKRYATITVQFEGRDSILYVHKLQAYQKFGETIFGKNMVVRHKNGNSLDNSYDNILLGTASDNQLDIPEERRRSRSIYAAQFMRIWSDVQLKEIFNDRYTNNFTYSNLVVKYKIAKSTLSFLFNKSLFSKTWKREHGCVKLS